MTRTERQNGSLILIMRPARFGTIATLSVSLLLGACSTSSDLYQSIAAKKPAETETSDLSSAEPQTELQKATIYWGQEYAKKPTDLKTALNYAKDLKALGENQKALEVLQQSSLIHGDSKELASEYGRLALALDQVGAANQLLTIADDPTRPDWRVISARGTDIAKQGKYSEAIPFYERALLLAPNNPSVMNNLAMAHAMMGDPKKAEEILRQASTQTGATPKIRENLALVLGLQGRYDESKSIASAVLDSGAASANADYLKQMVKLDGKSAIVPMPSFITETTVAPAEPAPTMKSVATANAAGTASVWQTSVADSASPAIAADAVH